MRSTLAALLVGGTLVACSAPSEPPPGDPAPAAARAPERAEPAWTDPLDQALRVTPSELKALADSGEVVIVDVRNEGQWQAGGIEGAVHIPYGELFESVGQLPIEKWIAFYCT